MQDTSECSTSTRSHNRRNHAGVFWNATTTTNTTPSQSRAAQAELIQTVVSRRQQRRSFILLGGGGADARASVASTSSAAASPQPSPLLLRHPDDPNKRHANDKDHDEEDPSYSPSSFYLSSPKQHHNYGAIAPQLDWNNGDSMGISNGGHDAGATSPGRNRWRFRQRRRRHCWNYFCDNDMLKKPHYRLDNFISQLPAILVTCLLLFMAAVPFGVAYFPVGWAEAQDGGTDQEGSADNGADGEDDDLHGTFPAGMNKAAMGIRMCLFSTMAGQFAMTFTSQFANPVVYQLIENVPFYHALARIVVAHQGYGRDALSTLFFLFGLGSVLVGVVFWVLGKYRMGRVVYFFPSHVLVGCIGGIGVFVILTSIEVTNNQALTADWDGLVSFGQHWHLFGVVLVLEILLRWLNWKLVDKNTGEPLFALLDPVFFCSIVPVFYLVLYAFQIDVQTARDWGYFLPDPLMASASTASAAASLSFSDRVWDGHLWDIFSILSFQAISWTAVSQSLGTLLALTAFSLLQVPIMIPAFAAAVSSSSTTAAGTAGTSSSTAVDFDMDIELQAHGFSNGLAGLFGGLQNVMTYSFSILYHKSGGYGKASSLVLVALTGVLFVVGPALAAFIPRAMAGTLLLHIGIDLFLEGVYDSFGIYDALEYSGIWFITITMTTLGMTAALLAGAISALITYAVQSIAQVDPIFSIVPATTLRSSAWGRSPEATFLLDHEHTGRARILVVQLQGHLFFGNVASIMDSIKQTLHSKKGTPEEPLIVILDFTLVVGLDSSAAMAVAKMKSIMHQLFHVEVTVFVTGSHRGFFPCEYALTEALNKQSEDGGRDEKTLDWDSLGNADGDGGGVGTRHCQKDGCDDSHDDDSVSPLAPTSAHHHHHHHHHHRESITNITPGSKSMDALLAIKKYPNNRVCASMDEALIFAEEILIARVKPELLPKERQNFCKDTDGGDDDNDDKHFTLEEELKIAARYLENLVVVAKDPTLGDVGRSIELILSKCTREEYTEKTRIWRQGDESFSAKLLIRGKLKAYLEGANVVEIVHKGSLFGELGLVEGSKRLSTVETFSARAVVYSLDRDDWEDIARHHPRAARVLDHITIRYLTHRVQHVSNRIVETRCLPI